MREDGDQGQCDVRWVTPSVIGDRRALLDLGPAASKIQPCNAPNTQTKQSTMTPTAGSPLDLPPSTGATTWRGGAGGMSTACTASPQPPLSEPKGRPRSPPSPPVWRVPAVLQQQGASSGRSLPLCSGQSAPSITGGPSAFPDSPHPPSTFLNNLKPQRVDRVHRG
jgi:hypothetical protein